jgi:hypothetical protein
MIEQQDEVDRRTGTKWIIRYYYIEATTTQYVQLLTEKKLILFVFMVAIK